LKVGDISVSNLHVIQQTLVGEGVDPSALFESFGISEALLGTAYARISLSKYMRIGCEAIHLTGKPWLGLLLGQNAHVGSMGLSSYAAMTAPTLSDALSTTVRFESLGTRNIRGDSQYYLDVETGNSICQLFSLAPYNRFNYFAVDTVLSSWYSFAKWATGKDKLLKQLEIEYQEPDYKDRFEAFFQCPVYFGCERNALTFYPEAGQLPCRFANMASHQHAVILCERELAALSGDNTFRDRIVEIIAPLLQGQPPTIEDVAGKVGMASWTLRRKLKKEGTTYQKLLDHTRKELAESYISDSIHSFTEVAYILGFSSPAAFHRAFKRWMGVSPGEYRKP
jgi:AraC-like DNA-binding protein